MSLIPAHSDSYVPKSANPELPVVLSSLFDNSLAHADYPTLLKKSEEAFELLQVTKKQQELVEEKTREQASSRLWFRMRTGRITASKLKNACHTDPACPSHSLIMSICHPEIARFNTEGGEHGQMVGCDNDDCPYPWFHLDCLKLKAFPKSKTWYCPECQKRRRGKYPRVQRAD